MSTAGFGGITRNLIDCYVALIQLWRPGDRIFLIGFSRRLHGEVPRRHHGALPDSDTCGR
jgi:Uncharacterized alpha/beta hydrolase domain (DUF2235)